MLCFFLFFIHFFSLLGILVAKIYTTSIYSIYKIFTYIYSWHLLSTHWLHVSRCVFPLKVKKFPSQPLFLKPFLIPTWHFLHQEERRFRIDHPTAASALIAPPVASPSGSSSSSCHIGWLFEYSVSWRFASWMSKIYCLNTEKYDRHVKFWWNGNVLNETPRPIPNTHTKVNIIYTLMPMPTVYHIHTNTDMNTNTNTLHYTTY